MTPTARSRARERARRWLLIGSLAAQVGCSDFLGIDQFEDRGSANDDGDADADAPGGGGGGAGGAGGGEPLDGGLLWWSAFGAAGLDGATSVAPLPDGVQLAGLIEGAVDFGGGAVGSPGAQAFVARLDLDGKHLWSLATSGDGLVESVAVDTTSDGGAVLAGSYRGALVLGGEPLPAPPANAPALFVGWLTPDGVVERVVTFPAETSLSVAAVATSPAKEVAVVGELEGDLDAGTSTLAGSPNDIDAMLLVLGTDGGVLLATNLRTTGDTHDQRLSTAHYDDGGALWLGGTFRGELAFANTTLASVGTSDGLVARIDHAGALQSHLRLGGGQTEVDVTALSVDEGVTLGATFTDRVVVGELELEAVGAEDLFVARLDGDLSPTWATTMGSQGPEQLDALGVDAQGHTAVTGSYAGDLTLDERVIATCGGAQDALVTKLDGEGAVLWTRSFGRQGQDRGHGLAVDPEGRLVVAGTFTDGITLDDEILKASGEQDIFVMQLDE